MGWGRGGTATTAVWGGGRQGELTALALAAGRRLGGAWAAGAGLLCRRLALRGGRSPAHTPRAFCRPPASLAAPRDLQWAGVRRAPDCARPRAAARVRGRGSAERCRSAVIARSTRQVTARACGGAGMLTRCAALCPPRRSFDEECRLVVRENLQKRGISLHLQTNPTKCAEPGGSRRRCAGGPPRWSPLAQGAAQGGALGGGRPTPRSAPPPGLALSPTTPRRPPPMLAGLSATRRAAWTSTTTTTRTRPAASSRPPRCVCWPAAARRAGPDPPL